MRDWVDRHPYICAVLIGLTAVIIAALAGLFSAMGQRATDDPKLYDDTPLDATLLRIDRQALEEAYHQRIVKLFDIWLSNTQASDATAFRNGLRIARRGYNTAAQEISKREQKLLEQDRQQQR